MPTLTEPIVRAPILTRALSITRGSLNEEARTVEVVFATERPVASWLPEIGDYEEVLECREESCDTERIKAGTLQVLSQHDDHKPVGVVTAYRFENGQGIATLRFSKRTAAEEEWQDIRDGIRNNLSVRYRVRELTLARASEEEVPLYHATLWEPLEVSVVSVGADPSCHALRSAVRAALSERTSEATQVTIKIPAEYESKRSMIFHIADTGTTSGGGNAAADSTRVDPAEFERQLTQRMKERDEQRKANTAEIRDSAAGFKEGGNDVSEISQRCIDENITPDEFRKLAIAEMRKRQQRPTPSGSAVQVIGDRPQQPRSIGEILTADAGYKAARGTSRRAMEVKIPDATNFRATLLTTTTTGFTPTLQPNAPILVGTQEAHVADLLAQGTTNLGAIPYWREDTFTNAATSVAEEGLKPEATWDLSQQSAPVIKIGVIGRVSDEVFDDFPSMESYVNARLRYSVEIKEDYQILQGAGGADLTGIIATSNVQSQALGGDTKPDAIRKAMTKIQVVSFLQPDGVVFHPNDWEQICLLKDTAGQYLAGGPFYAPYGNGQYVSFERFWALNVVTTTSCPEGTAVVGAWKMGGMLWRRKGLTLDTTNSDGEDFRYNRIAIRAEERVALQVQRPPAFCLVTGI